MNKNLQQIEYLESYFHTYDDYRDFQFIQSVLDECNEKWKLDFVSATAGNCCQTCSTYFTVEYTQAYNDAKTILILKWYYDGMNYQESPILSEPELYVRYDLGDLDVKTVCADLELALNKSRKRFKVIAPASIDECIELVNLDPDVIEDKPYTPDYDN